MAKFQVVFTAWAAIIFIFWPMAAESADPDVPLVGAIVPLTDALNRAVSPRTVEEYESVVTALPPRRVLSEFERQFLLTMINSPEADHGAFKNRVDLVRYFIAQGLRAAPAQGAGIDPLARSDDWRLVRAAHAASKAFDIPPAVVLCLTFRESSFDSRATNWSTSAKGIGQLTNQTVTEVSNRLRQDPHLHNQAETYVQLLRDAGAVDAVMPQHFELMPDAEAFNERIRQLQKQEAPASAIAQAKQEKQRAIAAYAAAHKDEPGNIFNLETNFGISAAYLSDLRHRRFSEVPEDQLGWMTAVGAYNQGAGVMNELIYRIFKGSKDYEDRAVIDVFNMEILSRLVIDPKLTDRDRRDLQKELHDEVMSVYRCASR